MSNADKPLTNKQIEERIDAMLLDFRNASASKEQRAALRELCSAPEYKELDQLVQTSRNLHRSILTQLMSGWIARGSSIPITGRQRTQLANEAWNIMLASDLYVKDRIAADEFTQSEAEQFLAALHAAEEAGSASSSPVDGLTEPGANLTVSDGGLVDPAPTAASPRPVFDATGQLATATPEE